MRAFCVCVDVCVTFVMYESNVKCFQSKYSLCNVCVNYHTLLTGIKTHYHVRISVGSCLNIVSILFIPFVNTFSSV